MTASWLQRSASWTLALALLSACRREEVTSKASREEQLSVFAAASLQDSFTALAWEFERARSGVRVTFNFAGSQELRTQLEHGAKGDVFASADSAHMQLLVRAGHAQEPRIFAFNEPVIVVATNLEEELRGIEDLPRLERIVIGAEAVPIGRYTLAVLDRASERFGADFRSRVEQKVVSRELNVRQVLAKVRLGEAQAGFVYRTDALAAGADVAVVTIPEAINVTAEYPLAVMTDAPHPDLAAAWVEYVLSPRGQAALARGGFRAPTAAQRLR